MALIISGLQWLSIMVAMVANIIKKTHTMEHNFITYVRTLQFWQLRLKGKQTDYVYIPSGEVKHYNINLQSLIDRKEIEVKEQLSNKGNKYYTYKALQKGNINLSLIKPKGDELNEVHRKMMYYLMNVSLPTDAPRTVYFDAFLKYREYKPRLFFTVDNFSKRVHTPVSSFSKEYRPNLLLFGDKTFSFDVATMQPLLLGKILHDTIGENDFSEWINNGKDVYGILQEKANLSTRDEAKKKFFEILFGKPNKQLETLFNASNWINWINEFKNKPFTPNPHTLEKNHSNLAYLLQTTEVTLMTKLWVKLIENNIPFVSVHDEVIVQIQNSIQTLELFKSVMESEFVYYKINYNKELQKTLKPIFDTSLPIIQNEITKTKERPKWNIEELEKFFEHIPDQQIRLSKFENIISTKKFVENHLSIIKHNNGKKSFEPYYDRLLKLMNLLKEKNSLELYDRITN